MLGDIGGWDDLLSEGDAIVLDEDNLHELVRVFVVIDHRRNGKDELDDALSVFVAWSGFRTEDIDMLFHMEFTRIFLDFEVIEHDMEKVEELTKANEALQYENQGLRAKYAAAPAKPIVYLGDEEEFYQGEIRDMVLGTLDEALSATEKATRKADVLEDILENNPYYHLSEERKQRIKALFKGYKNLTGAMRQELLSLGFEISESGKHYKITYRGASRYMVTVGKTPSDNRSGSNNAAMISKTML